MLVGVEEVAIPGDYAARHQLDFTFPYSQLGLAVEASIAVVGVWLYLTGGTAPRARRTPVVVLTGIVLALTVFGMTAAPAPPGVTALAASSLAADLAVAGLAAWLGRGPAAAGGSIRPRP